MAKTNKKDNGVSKQDQGQKAGKAKVVTTTTATPEPQALASVPVKTRPASIRSTIMECLADGLATTVIAERLKTEFPNSAAAQKSTKHIAFYRSLRKKQQKLEQAAQKA